LWGSAEGGREEKEEKREGREGGKEGKEGREGERAEYKVEMEEGRERGRKIVWIVSALESIAG
jgi:hypothetical protein